MVRSPYGDRPGLDRRVRATVSARDDGTSDQLVRVGGLVHEARQGRFTLDALAEASGVSAGLISQIERGLGNPSLSTLHKLADALGFPVSRFFDAPVAARRMLVRKDERMTLALPGPGHVGLTYQLLTPDFQGAVALFLTSIPPHWDNEEQRFVGQGEEVLHVLDGKLEVHVVEETFLLKAGDTITYDDSLEHWFKNPTDKVVRIINATVPPML